MLSLFYNGQSGRPYSVLFNTDVNADGTIGNDLIFVPASVERRRRHAAGRPQQLEDYIAGDERPEREPRPDRPRNASRCPGRTPLDFRVAFERALRDERQLELTVDVLNVLNLINSEKGLVQFPANQNISPIQFGGIDAASGKPIYNIATLASPTFTKFTTDDLRSRWQAQFGVRVSF